MKNILYINMSQDDPKTGWKPAAEIAITKGITHLLFSVGHWTSPNFVGQTKMAKEFTERYLGFKPIIGQHLFAPNIITSSVLSDSKIIEELLLIRVFSFGKRYETCIDVEPQNEILRRMKSASIDHSTATRLRQEIPVGVFDYVLPEVCGWPNSMYQIFTQLGKIQIAEQSYRHGAGIRYPIHPSAVIGLAVVPDGILPPDNEYSVSSAWTKYLDRDRMFYPVLKDKNGTQIATLVDVVKSFL